jgi:predicted nucleic acid-binding protein
LIASRFVIDNSIVMSWCFEDEGNSYAEAVLESIEAGRAFVPAIWPLEVGNVLLVAERKKRLSHASAVRFLDLLGGLPISVEQETPERMRNEILSLAREYDFSTYEPSYLDLAIRLDLPISTQDISLANAAGKCEVPIYEPPRSS